MSTSDPEQIYQSNLDRVTRRFFSGDLTGIEDLIAIPSELHTLDAGGRVDRLEDLVDLLTEQRNSLLRLGTTEYHRICLDAKFTDPEEMQISGRHRTYVLRSGTYVMAPYQCRQRLEKQGALWRACHIRCDVKNTDYTIINPKAIDPIPPERTE